MAAGDELQAAVVGSDLLKGQPDGDVLDPAADAVERLVLVPRRLRIGPHRLVDPVVEREMRHRPKQLPGERVGIGPEIRPQQFGRVFGQMEHLRQLEVVVLFRTGHVVEMAFLPSGAGIEQAPEDQLYLVNFGRIDEFGNAEVALLPERIGLLLAQADGFASPIASEYRMGVFCQERSPDTGTSTSTKDLKKF